MIITAVLFDAGSTVMGLLPLVVEEPPVFLPQLASLFSLIASLLFLFFLKRVAGYIQQQDLHERARGLIVLTFALFTVLIFTAVGAALAPVFAAFGGFAIIVMALLMLLRYARLLVDLRWSILELGGQSSGM